MKANLVDKYVALRMDGMNITEISRELGVSRQTLYNWSSKLNHSVEDEYFAKLDEIKEKYALSLMESAEYYARKSKEIRQEIENRGLEDQSLASLIKWHHYYVNEFDKISEKQQFTTSEMSLDQEIDALVTGKNKLI